MVRKIKKSEFMFVVTFLANPNDPKINHEWASTTVGIHNGLVTVIWSIALLIALAAAVRFLLVFVSKCTY